jgi:hypothetical protein
MDELWVWVMVAWDAWIVETWRGLPGPNWVKVLLIAVCLAIPGPQDELLLLAITAACRARKARQAN